jgi:hypothetical protein
MNGDYTEMFRKNNSDSKTKHPVIASVPFTIKSLLNITIVDMKTHRMELR